ncbi:MAG: alpha-L-arabinofuranosidase C-terminal domain-containing protein [Verrucomicrobiia bacterium]
MRNRIFSLNAELSERQPTPRALVPAATDGKLRVALFLSVLTAAGLVSCFAADAAAQADPPASITVQVDKPGAKVSPLLWGIFFEDINLSADGGIYPEFVRNRSFEDAEEPQFWKVVDGSDRVEASIDSRRPLNPLNRRSLRLALASDQPVSIVNEGYWGMNVVRGAGYTARLAARAGEGFNGSITLTLESRSGERLAEGRITGLTTDWKQFSLDLTASGADPKARLKLTCTGPGQVWLDMVSVLPKHTWKGHGLRPDLCEMLEDLEPAFLRFPGGCWVEGEVAAHMYKWKETIGDAALRKPLWNIWGYYATHGLGYHEYLQLAEDLGAEPLFCINVGMSHQEVIPMDHMGQWVQDALDAIEYANGPADSVWGAFRARNGHPAPFNMKYIEIGNENGGPAYQERYNLFHDAIKARYPEMQLIANVPTQDRRTDIVDEHYYNNPEFFMAQSVRYDAYPRDGAKIFVGEYAVTSGGGQGNLRAAVGEAAFMTGLERNSDVVVMAAYAPLFVNTNHRRWNPDLINFDSSRVYGLPGYYVQQMFSKHRGAVVLPIDVQSPTSAQKPRGGAIGVGTWITQAEFKDIKVVHDGRTVFASDFSRGTEGWELRRGEWKAEDGVLRQTSAADNVRAFAGDKNWTDYTYSLKARKLGGNEGFLISFHVQDQNEKSWWNLGGWGNQRHAIEMGGIVGNEVPGRIETGRWYDIRVEVNRAGIRCYLEDKLIHDVKYPSMKALYASATRVEKSGEVILKVVNTASEPVISAIDLKGASRFGTTGQSTVLTAENPTAENSLEHPKRVAPVSKPFPVAGPRFEYAFPGNSVTVLRIPRS